MHALIVISHPVPTSLTHAVAAHVAKGIELSGSGHTFEIADLSAEGFDPRYTASDMAAFHQKAPFPADVLAEQKRVERADAMVLVYPVYAWSMPAHLKGWGERVFANGWAWFYDHSNAGSMLIKNLNHLQVHLLAIGGSDIQIYKKLGYLNAMRTQIDHGMFFHCGAKIMTSELMLPPASLDFSEHLDKAFAIGCKMFATE